MISSSRLMNSGRKCRRRVSISSSRALPGSGVSSPSWRSRRAMTSAPTLLVAMIRVLVKSTTRPLPSVRRPSSKTCSRILCTSEWAFSISSSRMTLNGRRRTRSVSWPPSS